MLRSVQDRHLAAGGWLKCLFRGDLLDLGEASGRVEGETVLVGRPCVVASVQGLRSDDRSTLFRLSVDTVDGLIMRLERLDAELLVQVESLTTAEAI